MYFKIALGNVRKSYKDYGIYFLTLTLAVSIFYSFNSIETQKAVAEIGSVTADYIGYLVDMLGGVSVFVSIILGGLILYANNFLIKKRKKELGLYMSLGMSKRKISRILVIETFFVAAVSLVSGLALGVILSQVLSIITANLFEIGMGEYRFEISVDAILRTIAYFSIMFGVVMLFNVAIISRYKIIDLLVADRKNEEMKFRSPLVHLVLFLGSILSLGIAYKIILEIGLDPDHERFGICIGLGILGTGLFFYSISGFLLYILGNNEKTYFKGLNIFVMKQINNKVNTNFLSMSVICLMLLLTIGILSTVISFKSGLEGGIEESTPFDASGKMYVNEDNKSDSIKETLEVIDFEFDYENEEYAFFDEYESDCSVASLATKEKDKEDFDINAVLVKESEYNEIRKLQGMDEVSLGKDEVIISSNIDRIMEILDSYIENDETIEIGNIDYKIQNKESQRLTLRTNQMSENIFTIVVEDDVVAGFEKITSTMNVNYKGDKEKSEKKYTDLFDSFFNRDGSNTHMFEKADFILGATKDYIYEENKGTSTSILFLGVYLEIVFLISSMAVLGLQQLSEASDSIERYKALRKIGATESMINKSIFVQTLVYFSLPIGLALVHSVVGVTVVNEFIMMFNNVDLQNTSFVTGVTLALVYVCYFVATYIGYKNIVRTS